MNALSFKNQILTQYKPMMVAALHIMGDSDEASDIVQDVMRRLWESHQDLEEPDNPRAFCVMAVRNQCISRFRELKRHQKIPIDDAPEATASELSDTDIISSQGVDRINQILARLPEQRRQVLTLSMRGLSNAEISAELGLSDANVRQLLSRARLQVKDLLNNNKK
jgi:RNA polymerase sigma-70 factor (ECF subfamily)